MARVKARGREVEGEGMIEVVHLLSGDLWAGAESASAHLIGALASRGDLRVRALLLNEGELARRLRAQGIAVEVEPEAGCGFRELSRAVARRLAGCDLVHAHRYKEDLLAALSGRPWIATQHGRPEPFRGGAALRMGAYLALDLLAKRLSARRVIAVSAEVQEWLSPRIGAGRCILAPNGISDPAARLPVPAFPDRPQRVGVLARLAPVKGIELAIAAVARVPGLELEIVGDGPLRGELEARARASGAGGRIRFTGFDPEPLARVAQWRALLVTSHHEGHPISVLEALALSTPVLAGPLRGVADALAGQGGRLLPDRRPERWAAALEELRADSGPGAALGRQGRQRFAAAFEAGAAAARMAGLYAEVLAGTSPECTGAPQPGAGSALLSTQTRGPGDR